MPDGAAVSADWIKTGKYELESMGKRFSAKVHLKSPFDSANNRIQVNENLPRGAQNKILTFFQGDYHDAQQVEPSKIAAFLNDYKSAMSQREKSSINAFQ